MKDLERSPRAFIMRVSDDEAEDMDEYEDHDRPFVVGRRFACDELYTRCIITFLACNLLPMYFIFVIRQYKIIM